MTSRPSGAALRRAGPPILHGFRLFFLTASIWAVLAMAIWVPLLRGIFTLPGGLGPIDWHAHEMVFGYVFAVVAGFLLTAVPNWTGRLPLTGRPIAVLGLLWLAGRIAMASAGLAGTTGPWIAAGVDLVFPLVLALAIGREILAARNQRNLKVLVLLALLIAADAGFHAALILEADTRPWLRAGLGVTLLLIMLVGGRIVPSFTRNWLAKQPGTGPLPVPFNRVDAVCMAVAAVALALWAILPEAPVTAWAALVAGLLHLVRLSRWAGWRTGGEALVLVLHLAYAFVPIGFLAVALSVLLPGSLTPQAALHAWSAGAVGLMTLAVMSRAALGHGGLPLTAGPAARMAYVCLTVATLARIAAGSSLAGDLTMPLTDLAAACWIAGFLIFVIGYRRVLTGRSASA